MTKILSSSIIILLLFSACVEPYTPVIESNIESALVVDALITNDYAVQWVRLSNASPLDKPDFHPLNNATVSVEDDLGERIIFIFRKDGLYTPDNFAGEAGRSYKLLIDMNNGKHYESDYQSLKTVNPFDSVYYSLTEQPTTDPAVNIDGAQFFLDFPSQRDTDTYYIYHLEETYEYNTDLRLYWIDKGEGLQKATDPLPMKCWKTSSIKKFFITRSLASGSAQEQTIPLHFVPFNTRQFSVRYSLQVTQLAVSEEIYNYYYKINQQNKSGSLYSSQPYSIPGNIHNTNNPREQVLGSFAAGGIYQKRDFFNSPFFAKFSYQTCVPVTDPLVVGAAIAIGGTREAPLYITEVQGAKGISSDECFVCALRGGSPVKPDFWVDPYQK